MVTEIFFPDFRQNVKQDKGEKIPEFEPPRLMNLERKLQILNGEWFEESMFQSKGNDDVAALYAFYQPAQGPFIIVPSMTKTEVQADFTLTSKYPSFILLTFTF